MPGVARGESLDQRPDVLGHDARRVNPDMARLTWRILDRSPGLFRQAQDLAGERREPAPARSQCNPAPVAHEQLVAKLLA